MWIDRFQILNFSSFSDSGWIDLDKSFNLFVGQNNSGKSALLKAFKFPLAPNPHKTELAFRGTDLHPPSCHFDLRISSDELFRRFSVLNTYPRVPCKSGEIHHVNEQKSFLSDPDSILSIELARGAGASTEPRDGCSIAACRRSQNLQNVEFSRIDGTVTSRGSGGSENLPILFDQTDSQGYFYFDAQRLNVGKSTYNSPTRLLPDASNLACVLANLQGTRRPVFDIIERNVISVLGGIERITVAPRETVSEILVWPRAESRYEDLSFSLDESGTGVGQLLAILTAVATADQSVIIIDEINTFLHPAAVKRLLSLLRADYNHHQYIISTHSSDVIAHCAAEKLYIVERHHFESSIRAVTLTDAQHAKDVAAALGFSMMDVFGHERVVWVEGPTEEACFPYLAREARILDGTGIGFAPVHSTSELASGRRSSRSALEIYEQAGKRLSPLLKGMAFGLDRERLSDEEVARLERSKRKLRFLPRRCLECYFLDPSAISEVLSALDNRVHAIDEVEIALALGSDQKYGAPRQWNGDIQNLRWLKKVDGAKLISDVFEKLTDNRVSYRKTRDGIAIMKSILRSNPQSLSELQDFCKKLVDIALRDTAP